MATSTLGWSPGVRMSWSEMWTWKADTPARVPAGARISAGKSGRVAVSLPNAELTVVNWRARELHAVAGVAGEPDHHPVELGGLVPCRGGHREPPVSGSDGAPDRPPGAGRASTDPSTPSIPPSPTCSGNRALPQGTNGRDSPIGKSQGTRFP